MRHRLFFTLTFALSLIVPVASIKAASVYTEKPDDPKAVFFTPDNFDIHGDGIGDDSDALQEAVRRAGGGILYIPEGKYRITKTIIVGGGTRLIGYGENRPVMVLPPNSPSFQWGTGKYMFHFAQYNLPAPATSQPQNNAAPAGRPRQGPGGFGGGGFGGFGGFGRNMAFSDASETCFYGGMDNIDIEIGEGNLAAIAVRFHVAQHSYLRHMDLNISTARAAVEDIGNQINDVNIVGGRYGIITKRTSPVWQFLLMDSHFEGQSEAAIRTMEAGFTLVRVSFENMPVAIQIEQGEVEQ
ncbi:MAG: hypothetical protein JXR40_07425, partial [Pontiellaceae bacterium]|nr:hypothetical protein [Pontiellaceae bacterium]